MQAERLRVGASAGIHAEPSSLDRRGRRDRKHKKQAEAILKEWDKKKVEGMETEAETETEKE